MGTADGRAEAGKSQVEQRLLGVTADSGAEGHVHPPLRASEEERCTQHKRAG